MEEPSPCPIRAAHPPVKGAALSHLTLVLGGARSGKSRYAEALLAAAPAPRLYVATAQPFDDEMRARIAQHRQDRASTPWHTVEAPLDPAAALAADPAAPALVDCLTLWLTNLMLAGHDPAPAADHLQAAIDARWGQTVLVANEIGLGIVPDNALARRFRDEAGRLHQRLAARADAVILMVAGLPMVMK